VARKKRAEEHENHERWLVSYADFITLLFAFFVVLYAISQVDLKKLSQAAKSFGNSFGGSQEVSGESDSSRRTDPDAWRYAPIFPNVVRDVPAGDDSKGLDEVRDRLLAILAAERLDGGVRVAVESRGVVIRCEPKALFQGAGTTLGRDGGRLLERLGAVIRTVGSPVLVTSRASPLAAADLPGSFERGAARASAVGRNLVASQRVPAGSLFLSSEGETPRPAPGAAAPRRVDGELEIVLIRKGQMRDAVR